MFPLFVSQNFVFPQIPGASVVVINDTSISDYVGCFIVTAPKCRFRQRKFSRSKRQSVLACGMQNSPDQGTN